MIAECVHPWNNHSISIHCGPIAFFVTCWKSLTSPWVPKKYRRHVEMLIAQLIMIQGVPIDCTSAVIASGLVSTTNNPLRPEIVVNNNAAMIIVHDRKDPVSLVSL